MGDAPLIAIGPVITGILLDNLPVESNLPYIFLSRLNSLKKSFAARYRPVLISSSAGTKSLSRLKACVIFSYSSASRMTAPALPFIVYRPVVWFYVFDPELNWCFFLNLL